MKYQERLYRIGLFGHYGQNNLGDEAVILSSIQNLSERIPNLDLVGLSINPDDTRERYQIESFPIRNKNSTKHISPDVPSNNGESQSSGLFIRLKKITPDKIKRSQILSGLVHLLGNLGSEIRFLRTARKRLQKMDALLICGSGQLEDFGGPWGYPYTILKWVLLAKSTGAKVFIASVGAGPPSHPLSYWMYKQALKRVDYLSFRNDWSKKVIEDRIPKANGLIYPDLAHSLKTVPTVRRNGQKEKMTVAINAMPAFNKLLMKGGSREKYDIYVENIAQLVNHVQQRGFAVNLFNSHTADLDVIDEVIEHLKNMSNSNVEQITIARNDTVQELVNTISGADLVVATRFHSTMIPLLMGKPVIGLCYHTKSKVLLTEVGLGDYYVDINDFTAQELCKKFDSLSENIDAAKKELASKNQHYSKLMDEQWDRIVELIKA